MAIYIGKRILSIIPIVLFASFLMFVMIKLGPVDPAEAYLAAAHIHPDDEVLAAKRHEFGLDQPLLVQYAQSVMKMCRLDFGTSYITNEPVWQEVVLKFPATIQLALCSILLAILVSVPIGFLSAIFKNGAVDYSSRVLSYIGACIPIFWLGYLLVYFFSVKLDWLPVEGRGTWQHLVLPSVTLALWLIAIYTRLLRTTVLEELQEAYVRYARTRGIKERVIMLKYVLRIAILPMITALGMNMGKLLTGAIIVEQVFSWPGFGRYFVQSIVNRDIPVIQCYVLLSVCIVVGCNLIVDLLQLYMDPRISRKGRADQ
ncbi:nickel ABC transporter permease subunit NikB [Paenibacillus mucilaginosus]|uniref:Nickel import system permease protein NikB n=2 Tax=Paenibacillus mucilaginosus TaxID=61624 RepID=I0BRA8_9BACL|nr:nickel ABC transporter permease subunit NikB [Paenibacillus mucilaginosus]AEI44826.1 nickel transport system (permease) [Paenibacillus mucilaginosus KNP414]AFH64905.1 nickel ABC transporter permease [Paenibacillus mucilaginosus K02]MCG7214872.1 nickel ABC transporter permease subunit NikB [Paenibacillus mucilaginosus]WDM26352.1 nickel ABC transporter permease subunit NikB [Paenibacillus mucilaginosus]